LIKDTGIGISAEGQKRLFRSFSQVDASDTRKYGGTGLGLAICKELVQLMGGEIGVESCADRGSTFWFTAVFESLTAEEEENIPPRKNPRVEIAALAGKKLLVVDDNTTNRKVVRLQAKAWGMEVDEAQTGTIALAILRLAAVLGKPYDLALLDMQMPEMTGEMLARQIRSEADIAATRLIMMTSLDDVDLMARLREIGLDGYFLKPIVASRLLDGLLEVIEKTSPSRAEGEASSASSRLQEIATPVESEIPTAAIAGQILVVEDTPVNQKVVLNQLRLLGYEADCANDGREALAQWEQGHYALIFMDCQMPVMDGYRATQILRQREGEEGQTIIIGLTAYAMKGDREKCLEAGMDDYLAKPVSKDDLAAMLEKWISSATCQPTPVPRASTNNRQPLIDQEQLDGITDGDREFQEELLRSFVDDARIDLEEAKQALKERDMLNLERKIHRIKGAAANLAITELSQVSATLERQARANQLENPDRLLAEIERLIEEVRQYLSNTNNEQSTSGATPTIPPRGAHPPYQGGNQRGDGNAHQDTNNQQPTTNNQNIIDREFLQSISGGDRNFEIDLLNSFAIDIETELQIAKVAFKQENYPDLVQHGNSFKGAAESLAVGLIPDLAIQLVESASQENREAIALTLQEIEQVLNHVKLELDS
jgi:CheY-like chemotaxis protein